jgi:uncharacterized integral membrane protein
MRTIYLIVLVIFALFIVTFSQQNMDPVTLKYYHYLQIPPIPLYMIIFGAFLLGVIIASFWGAVERFRLNRTIRKLNRLVRDLRKELHAHENPPIIENQQNNPK